MPGEVVSASFFSVNGLPATEGTPGAIVTAGLSAAIDNETDAHSTKTDRTPSTVKHHGFVGDGIIVPNTAVPPAGPVLSP